METLRIRVSDIIPLQIHIWNRLNYLQKIIQQHKYTYFFITMEHL